MCQFISAFFKPDTMEVRVADLNSHSETQKKLGLTDGTAPNGWREMHYLPNGTVECRALNGDAVTGAEAKLAVLARWPRFVDFMSWAVRQPTYIGGSLYLNGLTSAKGLVLPKSIGGSLDLRGLTSAEGLVLPKSIGGSLYLNGLTSAKGLVLPKSIGGYLDLGGLTSAEGLVLPKSIGGSLDLGGLTSAKGLVLPKSIGGYLYLMGLTKEERDAVMATMRNK